jgi:predicted amidohydrolase YtcJ
MLPGFIDGHVHPLGADLVVLDVDITSAAPAAINDATVQLTIKDGVLVFEQHTPR